MTGAIYAVIAVLCLVVVVIVVAVIRRFRKPEGGAELSNHVVAHESPATSPQIAEWPPWLLLCLRLPGISALVWVLLTGGSSFDEAAVVAVLVAVNAASLVVCLWDSLRVMRATSAGGGLVAVAVLLPVVYVFLRQRQLGRSFVPAIANLAAVLVSLTLVATALYQGGYRVDGSTASSSCRSVADRAVQVSANEETPIDSIDLLEVTYANKVRTPPESAVYWTYFGCTGTAHLSNGKLQQVNLQYVRKDGTDYVEYKLGGLGGWTGGESVTAPMTAEVPTPSEAPVLGNPSRANVDRAIDAFIAGRNALAALKGADDETSLALSKKTLKRWTRLERITKNGIDEVPESLTQDVASSARAVVQTYGAFIRCARKHPDTILTTCLDRARSLGAERAALDRAMASLFPYGSQPISELTARIQGPPLAN